MKKKSEILKKLEEAVIKGDKEAAKKTAEKSLSLGMDPLVALNEGLVKGILEVGERFGRLEIFLTGLIFSAEAMQAAIEVLKSKMTAEMISEIKLGKVIVGTVEKDIHDIGKNLVSAMLTAGGFEVHDIGTDVPAKKFIERAEEVEADIIALSALMTTTRPYCRDIINMLKDMGLRDKYKVMVGGGSVSKDFAEEIGADAWAKDAVEASEVAKKLVR